MITETNSWVWMPHAGHLIVGQECRFHLTTRVGKYLISTVGEWWPDETVRQIHADVRHIALEGRGDARAADFLKKCGYMEIGSGRTYKTMVFPVKESGERCCPWVAAEWEAVASDGYNDPGDAYHGHLEMCAKYDERYVCSTCQDTGQIDVAPDEPWANRRAVECPACTAKEAPR